MSPRRQDWGSAGYGASLAATTWFVRATKLTPTDGADLTATALFDVGAVELERKASLTAGAAASPGSNSTLIRLARRQRLLGIWRGDANRGRVVRRFLAARQQSPWRTDKAQQYGWIEQRSFAFIATSFRSVKRKPVCGEEVIRRATTGSLRYRRAGRRRSCSA